jgi:hypothetical protein
MLPWIMLIFTLVFAYLTYDALSLVAPSLPYSETAKQMEQDLSFLTVAEQEKLNQYPNRIRIGDVNQTAWVFGIATVGFAVATVQAFLE